jgi:hypothetical protein
MNRLGRVLPEAIVSLVFLAGALTVAMVSRSACDGIFVYPLDDPYIHMAMAKNLIAHGIYSPGTDSFAAASSSPLWTFLVAACFLVIGLRDWLPFVLNLFFGVCAIVMASSLLRRSGVGALGATLAGLAMMYLTPMIPVAFAGLEHMAHLFSMLLILRIASDELRREKGGALFPLALACAFAVSLRYESLFFIGLLAGIFVAYRRPLHAGVALLGALLPVCVFGLWSLANGGFFLPNSLLLKGHFPQPFNASTIGQLLYERGVLGIVRSMHLAPMAIALLASAVAALFARGRKELPLLLLAVSSSILLQVSFAAIGFFYRYEAFLLAMGIVLIAVALSALFRQQREATHGRAIRIVLVLAFVVAQAVLLRPVQLRATWALETCMPASRSIYRQQYQLARFVGVEFAPGTWIAANDIGCISFFTDARVLDLYGLASNDITAMRRSGRYTAAAIDSQLCLHGVSYAMLYCSWFENALSPGGSALPASLIEAGSMKIADNHGCADSVVHFFGSDRAHADTMAARLGRFRSSLPTGVAVGAGL